jgi:hypothetical protein
LKENKSLKHKKPRVRDKYHARNCNAIFGLSF